MKLKMFQSSKLTNNISSILGNEVEIKGDVAVSGDLLIYGKIHGDIMSRGEVIAAKGSIVKGNICAVNASISGTVEGNLEIESKVVLGKHSHLMGNLKATIITIEEGARFDGMCSMVKKNNLKQASMSSSKSSSSIHAANE